MLDTIKMLCNTDGVSGTEDAVRDKIISLIDGYCEYRTDSLGNLLCFKKGKKTAKSRILFSAHMDEVGFIVEGITPDGFLKLKAVGGILDSALYSRVLRTADGKRCVLGGKTYHLIRGKDAEKEFIPLSSLYGDIGASSREEAEKHVMPGDTLAFDTETGDFGENKLAGKALDDRVGCGIMTDMIRSDLEYDAYFNFTVCEEVGLIGAGPAAFSVNPDYAIVLEGTTAADLYGSEGCARVTVQGEGVAISFADRATVYDRDLFELAKSTAEQNGIACQVKSAVAGGNDAGSIHKTGNGVHTAAFSVPARYIHTSLSTVDTRDILAARALAEKTLVAIEER